MFIKHTLKKISFLLLIQREDAYASKFVTRNIKFQLVLKSFERLDTNDRKFTK